MSQVKPVVRRPDLLEAIVQGIVALLRSVARAAHALWLEVTGFLFLVLGVFLSLAAWREYQGWMGGAGPVRFALALGFAVLFVYFGVNSIWRARRRHG